MRKAIKRLLSLFLVLALLVPGFPAASSSSTGAGSAGPAAEAYAAADAVFAQIDAMEAAPAKKNATQTELTDAAEALVKGSAGYVEGSLERNGDAFTWWTEDDIRCTYHPEMRRKRASMTGDAASGGIYNEPAAVKGGWPAGKEVYLIGPYYGLDSSFTKQYKNEARDIAAAIGDTDGYTLYSGSAATVDKVAEAVSKGAVVIFDSHGNTDYVDPNANLYDDYEDDYVTGANYSYLCLSTPAGLTTQDYNDGAAYGSEGDAFINGAVIANHMVSDSPAGLVWMAICLGMATDTLCGPLRERGVEVVYGYSQSVTFGGDYCWEEVFWDTLCGGANVSASILAMKEQYGNWDCSPAICSANGWSGAYSTIASARANYAAFPIIVSDEDAHPGQRSKFGSYGADTLQTVRSAYTLYSQYAVTAESSDPAHGTVSADGSTITAVPAPGYYAAGYTLLSGSATVTQDGNAFYVFAESDCQIQITFAPKTPVTVQFSGAALPEQNGYAGDVMALPSAQAPDGYQFVGWTTVPVSEDTPEKPDHYSDSFTPAGSVTLYALYSYIQPGSSTGTGDYVKVTEAPSDWSGEYLIVYEQERLIFDGSLSKLDAANNYQAVTITGDTIAAAQGDAFRFFIASGDGGYTIQSISGQYIGRTENANGLNEGTTAYLSTISLSADDSANIQGSGGAYLRFNPTANQMRFRYYKSSTYTNQQPIALYRKDGTAGTVIYTAAPGAVHQHSFTQYTYNGDAACTENGTETAQCDHCEETDTRPAADTALGHAYGSSVTAPDCTGQGYTTHTCSRCQDSYTDTYTDPLGHAYGSSVTAPGCTGQGYTAHTCSRCDDSYTDTYTDPLGHHYVGQVTPPTASQQGYTTYTCSRCDDSYLADYTAPTGPSAITSTGAVVSGSYISKIPESTKVSALLSTLDAGGQYTVTQNGKAVASDALIGTGMVISLHRNGQVLHSVTVVSTGDISGDGKITITDMLAAKAHLLGKSKLENACLKAGDTNGDGKVTITDFIQLKAHVLNKQSVAPRAYDERTE